MPPSSSPTQSSGRASTKCLPAPCCFPTSAPPALLPCLPGPSSEASQQAGSLVLGPLEAYNRRGLKALGGRTKDPQGTAPRRPKEYVEAVEEVSREIHDPVAKLRFLRTSLRDYPRVSQVEEVPSGPARRVLYRWASFEHLRALSAQGPIAAFAPALPRKTLVTRAAAALTLLLAAGRLLMGLAALVVVFAVGSAA